MKNRTDPAIRVSVVTMAVNVVLTVFKLVAGIFSRSSAMVSDAIHSASDMFSTVIVMVGVKMSRKHSDDDHPYGHDRLENIAAILLSVALFITGAGIGYGALSRVISGKAGEGTAPGVTALIAAIVSIAVKEWMYHYTKAVAVREKCMSLKADAWHHRSDALSSVGSLFGIVMARLGFPVFDPLAGFVISIFIIKAAIDIFRDACDGVVDKSAPAEDERLIYEASMAVEGVRSVDSLTTRRFGSGYYVDIEISVDGELPLHEAHNISEVVHNVIETRFPDVRHCMVHVNPFGDGGE